MLLDDEFDECLHGTGSVQSATNLYSLLPPRPVVQRRYHNFTEIDIYLGILVEFKYLRNIWVIGPN